MRSPFYTGVAQQDGDEKEKENLVEEANLPEHVSTDGRQRAHHWYSRDRLLIVSVLLHALLLSTFIGLLLTVGNPRNLLRPGTAVTRNGRATIGDLFNEYHDERFQLEYVRTKYRGPPSPEVDAAWEELTENTGMIVPDADLRGQNTSSHWPLRGSNGNDHGVLAKFEGLHALHCVNLLWRHTWPDYYTKDQDEMREDPTYTHIHLDHCADMLRQTVQCNMDFSILTYYTKGWKVFHDFNDLHQCGNFDAKLEYMREHRFGREYIPTLDGYDERQRAMHAELVAGKSATGSVARERDARV